MKRLKLKFEKPNPLFELWLEEWKQEAVSKNSDLQNHFSSALDSLRKYPLPLKSGKDCIILKNFGSKLCLMLDKKLLEHKIRNESSSNDMCEHCNYDEEQILKRKYVSEIVRNVEFLDQTDKQKDSNEPPRLYKSKSAEFLTIENRKKQSNKNLEKQKSEENNLFTKKAREKPKKIKNLNNANNLDGDKTNSVDYLEKDVYLKSRQFDIILLVDVHETSGYDLYFLKFEFLARFVSGSRTNLCYSGKSKAQHDATVTELTELGVLFEIRHLKIGDFAWIARCRSTNSELVLPYILERKRIDDLSASIMDGRFHEQKFRLKQSGIKTLMYIIEEYEKTNQRLAIPYSSLMQASINTLIQDGFSVKYTNSHKDSMFYLSSLTRILINVFKEKNLVGCRKEDIKETNISNNTCSLMRFEEFNKAASKQKVFKTNEMFIRQLVQLKGMSTEKALAIVEHYPTPRVLVEAFRKSDCNGESLLANISYGNNKRLIGPVISKTIYQLYTKKNFN